MRTSFLRIPRIHSGRGRLGCIFSLLVLGTLVFGLYRIVPLYFGYYQLEDAVKEIATLSAVGFLPRSDGTPGRSSGTVPEIQEAVLAKAKELEIPLNKENVQVLREGQNVSITVSYVVPVDYLVGVYNYPLSFTVRN